MERYTYPDSLQLEPAMAPICHYRVKQHSPAYSEKRVRLRPTWASILIREILLLSLSFCMLWHFVMAFCYGIFVGRVSGLALKRICAQLVCHIFVLFPQR